MNREVNISIHHFRIILVMTICVVMMTGCKKSTFLKETGPVKSEVRNLAQITEVILYDKINLILTHDSTQLVKVEAGENLIEGITTSIAGSTLTIRNENKYNWMRDPDKPVNVYLSSAHLNQIHYFGAGIVSSTNELIRKTFLFESIEGVGSVRLKIKADETKFFIKDFNADITVEGSATTNHIYCAGTGTMELRNFDVSFTFLDYRSIKDSYLFLNGFISGSILYKGNVYYKGNPSTITIKTPDAGRLIKLN